MSQDILWKEAIETYFPALLAFFFPAIYRDVDFTCGYEFLDKELAAITAAIEANAAQESTPRHREKRYADMLVKVWLRDDGAGPRVQWLVLHIDVQGYHDPEFAQRMYIYNYRTFDRYRVDVISLAILTDRYPHYRPDHITRERWGFQLHFQFPLVKLLDYRERWAELEQDPNPFAVVVMARLKALETQGQVDERLFWKVTLVKALYERGYSKDDVLNLYRFIDEMLKLPPELAAAFHREIVQYEEGHKMRYITTAERIGIEKGLQQGMQQGMEKGMQRGMEKGMEKGMQQGREQGMHRGLLKAIRLGLELKFGSRGLKLYPEVSKISDVAVLDAVSEALLVAETLDEVRQIYVDALPRAT